MGYLLALTSFIVAFFMLRRSGGIGRHIAALIVGVAASLLLFGFYIAGSIPPGGAYSSEWLASIWALAAMRGVVMAGLGMLVALLIRRRAQANATNSPAA